MSVSTVPGFGSGPCFATGELVCFYAAGVVEVNNLRGAIDETHV